MIKGAIAVYWAATAHDRNDIVYPSKVGWDAAKFSVRGCTAAFLMYLLMKVNAKALPLQNPTSKVNHLFVPILLLGIFSMFFETLIDQYVGPFEKTLRLYYFFVQLIHSYHISQLLGIYENQDN